MLAANLNLMIRGTEVSSTSLSSTSLSITPSSPVPATRHSVSHIPTNPPSHPQSTSPSSSFLSTSPPTSAPASTATTPEGPKRTVKHVRSVSGTKEVAMTLGLKGNPASVSRWAAKDKTNEPARVINTDISSGVPPLVSKCIQFLMEKGYESVGIFRICASASVLKKLKARLLGGEDIDLFYEISDPDIVAGLLKAYYREADEPLYPESSHPPFLAAFASQNLDAAIARYTEAFHQLPQPTQAVSKRLFQLLHKISQYSSVNMMNPDNISICWAPTLFRSFSTEFIPIVVQIITEYEYIFEGKVKGETPREEVLETVQEEPTPEEANDGNDGYEDLPPPPTPPVPHKPGVTPLSPRKEGGSVNQPSEASESGNGRPSWVPHLDSPRSSTALGPRLQRRLSTKGSGSSLAGTPVSSRPTRSTYVNNNQKYATMVFSQALLNASEEPA